MKKIILPIIIIVIGFLFNQKIYGITGSTDVCVGSDNTYTATGSSSDGIYTWRIPANASVILGAGTKVIIIRFNASGMGSNIGVTGNGVSENLSINAYAKPSSVGPISGSATVCRGASSVTYSIYPNGAATGYSWIPPVGATITSQSGTTVTVTFSGSFTSGTLSCSPVFGPCGIGPSASINITTSGAVPIAAGSITGSSTVCPGVTGVAYSVGAISGATGYTWILPTGATLSSGVNTNSILVNFSNSFTGGSVTVYGTNCYGNGPSSILTIAQTAIPSAAGAINSTNSTVCAGATGITYSVAAISGATGYSWTVPSGATITAGANTNSIVVTFPTPFTSGNVSIFGTNCSGSGSAASLAVTSTPLPGAITSFTAFNNAICLTAFPVSATYTANPVAYATRYTWTLPAGIQTMTDPNLNSVTLNFSASAVSGNISVCASNCAGNGPSLSNPVTMYLPVGTATTAPILPNANSLYVGNTVTYVAPNYPNVITYNWIFPQGINIISGQGTKSVTVNLTTEITNGSIIMQPISGACGMGIANTYSITILKMPATAGVITGAKIGCLGQTGVIYSVPPITNASGYVWNLPAGVTITSGTLSTSNTISLDFSATTSGGDISVYGINGPLQGGMSKITITTNAYPIINQQPSTMGQRTFTNASFSVKATGSISQYQWQKYSSGNFVNIDGAYGATYMLKNIQTDNAGYYRVIVIGSGNCSVTSEMANLWLKTVQMQGYNLLISRTILQDNIYTENDAVALPVEGLIESTTYFDGLGRPVQTVNTQGSPSKQDIVQPIVYDLYGREAIKQLPYTSGNDGWYKTDAASAQPLFYKSTGTVANDDFPYAATVYQNSPLNRVIQQGLPGKVWQPSNFHAIGMDYLSNSTNEVSHWNIVNDSTCQQNGFYVANELLVTQTTNENGNTSKEYKDKIGHMILKQSSNGNELLQTYYVYDDLGLLRYVLPPQLIKDKSITTLNPSGDNTRNWCYYYQYDDRKRMITKQIPGAKPIFMVYDLRDRLILTQDGNQRNHKNASNVVDPQWMFTKYDCLNRPILNGIIGIIGTRAEIQGTANTLNAAAISQFESLDATSISVGYTLTQSYPYIVEGDLLTITYYDSYNFPEVKNPTFNDYITNTTINYNVKSQITGGKVRIIGDTTLWKISTIYYDNKYRPIQTIKDNFIGGTETVTNLLDFSGKIKTSYSNHTGLTAINIIKKFEYDHAGRLIHVFHKIGDQDEILMSYMVYNELGQLIDKKIHSTDTQHIKYLQSIDYRYNIRGWLKNINNASLGNLPTDPTQDDLLNEKPDVFGMEIHYNDTF